MASILQNILLCAIPEALYFSLFMIFAKNLKEKRILFCFLMIVEYAILMNIFEYNILFQVIYTFLTFLILKLLYKDKAIITDILVFALSSIILIAISIASYMIIYNTIKIYAVAYIINRILLFAVLFLLKNKLSKIYEKFRKIWNRNENAKIRSLTVRNISAIIFNIMFFTINFCLVYFLLYLK